MTYRYSLIVCTVLAVMIIVGLWFSKSPVITKKPIHSVITKKAVDYFLVNAVVKEYNETGTQLYQLKSANISHYSHNDVTLFQQPTITHFGDNERIVISSSNNGSLLPDGKNIKLWDNVVVVQKNLSDKHNSDHPEIRIDTDLITIHHDQEMADTDSRVKIRSYVGETTAVGMTIWYKLGKIVLKSEVRGMYEPD